MDIVLVQSQRVGVTFLLVTHVSQIGVSRISQLTYISIDVGVPKSIGHVIVIGRLFELEVVGILKSQNIGASLSEDAPINVIVTLHNHKFQTLFD